MSFWSEIKLQYRVGGLLSRLIYWNIGAFILSVIFFYKFGQGYFTYPTWLALSSNWQVGLPYFWTLITYSFLHAGIAHLIFNLIVLNFAGRLFLTFFSEKQLLGVYLLGAVFSGIVYIAIYSFLLQDARALLVGASASIMAILFATVSYAPMMQVRLLLVGNVKLWHIAGVILLIDILQLGLANAGGHISHLAGALFGFIFVTLLKKGTDLTKITPVLKNPFRKSKIKNTPFKEVYVNKTPSKPLGKIKTKNQQQIDEILDKISRSGYDSLTKEEKDFLFQQK